MSTIIISEDLNAANMCFTNDAVTGVIVKARIANSINRRISAWLARSNGVLPGYLLIQGSILRWDFFPLLSLFHLRWHWSEASLLFEARQHHIPSAMNTCISAKRIIKDREIYYTFLKITFLRLQVGGFVYLYWNWSRKLFPSVISSNFFSFWIYA
jgi:hypothetical protein